MELYRRFTIDSFKQADRRRPEAISALGGSAGAAAGALLEDDIRRHRHDATVTDTDTDKVLSGHLHHVGIGLLCPGHSFNPTVHKIEEGTDQRRVTEGLLLPDGKPLILRHRYLTRAERLPKIRHRPYAHLRLVQILSGLILALIDVLL